MLQSLKIKALGCVAKDTMSISLAERKPEVWGKCPPRKKQEKPQGHYRAIPPSPRGVKDIMVTQDTRSSLCSKRSRQINIHLREVIFGDHLRKQSSFRVE